MKTFLRTSSDERPTADAIRDGRVEVARRSSHWQELIETDLVRRARYLVHAETDELFKRSRGDVFAPGSASVLVDQKPLHFYITQANEVVFLEISQSPQTWSEVVAKRAQRQAQR